MVSLLNASKDEPRGDIAHLLRQAQDEGLQSFPYRPGLEPEPHHNIAIPGETPE